MPKKPVHANQKRYQKLVQEREWKPPRLRNALMAFTSGGLVCVLGQAVIQFYAGTMKISVKDAADPAVATMVLLGALLTGFGVFDKLARHAGAGLAVPVTGFANSIVSSALEFKREGLVFGVGGKMFQLAGSVIVFGVVTAFGVGIITAIFGRG